MRSRVYFHVEQIILSSLFLSLILCISLHRDHSFIVKPIILNKMGGANQLREPPFSFLVTIAEVIVSPHGCVPGNV